MKRRKTIFLVCNNDNVEDRCVAKKSGVYFTELREVRYDLLRRDRTLIFTGISRASQI